MGDFSRASINTSFNTGTVVGVCCNVFGVGLTPKYIPSFSWGYAPVKTYDFDKGIEEMRAWKKLKGQELTSDEIRNLTHIFEHH